MKISMALALSLVTIGFFAGCKKETGKKANCNLTKININDVTRYVGYNNDGKISSLTFGNENDVFTYNGNITTITRDTAGRFYERQIVTRNGDGLATNIRTEYDVAGNRWANTVYYYTGTEVSKSTYANSDSGKDTSIYTWSNHNLISIASSDNGFVQHLTYYEDKPSQIGDYLALGQFLGGYEVIRNKNLLKTYLNYTITHTFGADGNISSLKLADNASGSAVVTEDKHQYQCN